MKKLLLALTLTFFFFTGCSPSSNYLDTMTNTENQVVVLETSKGDITVEIFEDKTPITAKNFLDLSESGKYNEVKFHRVIPGFMVQTGDYEKGNGTGGEAAEGENFDDEIVEGLSNIAGTLSMANRGVIDGKGTNGSQFFINQIDNTYLDGKHTVFGKVLNGMETVEAIANAERDRRDAPLEDIVIKQVKFL